MLRSSTAMVFLLGVALPLFFHSTTTWAADTPPAPGSHTKKSKAKASKTKAPKPAPVVAEGEPPPPPSPPPSPPPVLPGAPPALGPYMGEHLTFNIHWMGMPVGVGEMRLEPDGKERYRLTASLDSKGPIHLIYPVRDRLTSRGMLLPWGFKPDDYDKDQLEGPRTRHVTYHFNRDDLKVDVRKDGEMVKVIDGMSPESGDPLSAFHGVRTRKELIPGNSFQVQMVDGEKLHQATITVGESKRLFTPLGWFQVIGVMPQVHSSSLFRHEGSLTIWLTDDERRLPVRVEGKVKIGEVAADLVGFDDGRGGHGQITTTQNNK